MTTLSDLYSLYCKRARCRPNTTFLGVLSEGEMLSFDLSANYVGPKGLEAILEVARNNMKLEILDLSNNWLEEKSVLKVVEMAVRHPSLKSLKLGSNPIHSSAFKPLAYLLANNKSIVDLGLEHTEIPSHQLKRLHEARTKNKENASSQSNNNNNMMGRIAAMTGVQPDVRVVTLSSKWEGERAGGSLRFSTWRNNPQFMLWPSRSSSTLISIKQPQNSRQLNIAVAIFRRDDGDAFRSLLCPQPTDLIAESNFEYGSSTVLVTLDSRIRGKDLPYIILPMCYPPGKESGFTVSVREVKQQVYGQADDEYTSTSYTLESIKQELDWHRTPTIRGEWNVTNAGGNSDYSSWRKNPQYHIKSESNTKVFILLTKSSDLDENDDREIGFFILRGDSEVRRQVMMTSTNTVASTAFRQVTTVSLTVDVPKGPEGYILLVATSKPEIYGKYELSMFSECDIEVSELQQDSYWQTEIRQGEWSFDTNGGSRHLNAMGWIHNTSYAITLEEDNCDILAVLQADTEEPISLLLLDNTDFFDTIKTEKSNSGECTLWINHLPRTTTNYVIVPSTVHAGIDGNYQLTIYVSRRCDIDGGSLVQTRIDIKESERHQRDNKLAHRERELIFDDSEFKGGDCKKALSVRDQIIDVYLKRGTQHLDREFPPSLASVFKDPTIINRSMPLDSWRRPSEYSSDSSLFQGGVKSGNIQVGCISDSWFLSAAALVATQPDLLQYLFMSVYPEYGFYQMRFFKYGEWIPVTIDDMMPSEASNALLFASSPKTDELWVSVLEKAYAKLHNSYESLEVAGDISHAITDLTGGVVEEINLQQEKSQEMLRGGILWSSLQSALRNKWPTGMVLNRSRGVRVDEKRSMGIEPDHLYPVLELRDVRGRRLVRLRDPWELHTWKGRWSDTSSQWTFDMQQALDYDFQDDGTLWMGWEDVRYYFTTIYICRMHGSHSSRPDHWHRLSTTGSWIAGTSDGGNALSGGDQWTTNDQFSIDISNYDVGEQVPLWIQVEQKDARLDILKTISHDGTTLQYPAEIGFHLISSDSNSRKIVALTSKESIRTSEFSSGRCVSSQMPTNPSQGSYTIVPCTSTPGQSGDFLITVCCPRPISMELIKSDMSVSVSGCWKGQSRGGAPGKFGTWRDNKMYLLSPSDETTLTIVLRQHNDVGCTAASVAILVLDCNSVRRPLSLSDCTVIASTPYENSEKVALTVSVKGLRERQGMPYTILPSTFFPLQDSNFTLEIVSNKKVKLSEMDPTIDWITTILEGSWSEQNQTAGGGLSYPLWRQNTQYCLHFTETTARMLIVLSKRLPHCTENDGSEIGIICFRATSMEGGVRSMISVSDSDIVAQSDIEVTKNDNHVELTLNVKNNGQCGYVLLPYSKHPYTNAEYTLEVYSENNITLRQTSTAKGWISSSHHGKWKPGVSAGGARAKNRTWGSNPNYKLSLSDFSNVVIVLCHFSTVPGSKNTSTRVSNKNRPPITDGSNNTSIAIDLCSDDSDLTHINRSDYTCCTEVVLTQPNLSPGSYVLVPHTFESEIECEYTMTVYSDVPVVMSKIEQQRKFY